MAYPGLLVTSLGGANGGGAGLGGRFKGAEPWRYPRIFFHEVILEKLF